MDLPLAFEGEKLVLWGKLEAGKPAEIKVSKTFMPMGLIPEDIQITHAEVFLFKNGRMIEKLSEHEGFYKSHSIIEAGASYRIKAEALDFPTAESNEVFVPTSVPQFTYERKGNVEPEIPMQGKFDLITLKIRNPERKYFMFNIRTRFREYEYTFMDAAKSNVVANEENCHTTTALYSNPSYFLVNPVCVSEQTPLSFFINVEKNFGTPDGKWETLRANKVSVEVVAITQEWFEYNKIENKQPDGLDHLVLPPQKAYTNIKNGYGLIYGSNGIKTDLF